MPVRPHLLSVALAACAVSTPAQDPLAPLRRDFLEPPADCRPHTRWWWPGNAISREDITWQLEQMRAQGIGGVEQITMGAVYERGNHEFLSPGFFERIVHAIAEARRLGMQVSLNFGGPGWIFGGEWVPPEDRNRNLLASYLDLEGGRVFDGELPRDAVLNPKDVPGSLRRIEAGDPVVAVLAGRERKGRIEAASIVDLTARVAGRRLKWEVPPGDWRLMAFWLVPVREGAVVNHINKRAMERYCEYVGGRFRAAFGAEFGRTVESFFSDSFEVPIYRNGIYWSQELMGEYRARMGYDLVRHLPALWWEVDQISPKIRYDVNHFLHRVGMEAFFDTFLGWCERNGVKGRIQPYGFVTDILEGAGRSHIPELEITAGEKDAVPWFDMRIGPRTYTASGARLYGRNIVSVEAYTYLHWQPARDTLEELKISGDMFLRAGANKFYNAGYTGTPEREFVPSRRFHSEMLISHVNVWWPYYRLLSDYVARCSAMLRHGRPAADVAVYSPLANQWTLDVLNARRWTRDFDWGPLAKLLLANGYDFDLVNDDVLVRRCELEGGRIRVRDLSYGALILPNIRAMPVESLRRVEEYARGGGVVIALEQTPSQSTGLAEWQRRDQEVRAISARMFREPEGRDGTGPHRHGQGHTYFIRKVIDRANVLDWRSSALDPFANTLRRHMRPDFGLDFVREAMRENDGLTFAHRASPEADIYFVTNVQERAVDTRVAFRVTGKRPEEWNPMNGEVAPLHEYDDDGTATVLPVRLAPFESTFFVFTPGPERPHLRRSSFRKVVRVDEREIEALADRNGVHSAGREVVVEGLPAPFEVAGRWRLALEGKGFGRVEKTLDRLASWTEDPATRHFSGTGSYQLEFELPATYIHPDLELLLTLGDLGNLAEVELNGKRLGVIWMRGQRLDATAAARAGSNRLALRVTNTLVNRVAGFKEMPPVPAELQPLYGKGIDDHRPLFRELFGFEPLPRSGLLGPVLITPLKRVRIGRD